MDPVAAAPIFVATTAPFTASQRQQAAFRAVLAAGTLIIGFAFFGGAVLDYLDVSVDSLSIAGGLLLLLVALEMLRGMDYPDATSAQDVALVPIATPLLAGPGAIATVIVLTRSHHDFGGKASVLAGTLCALAVVGLGMILAERLSSMISKSLGQFLTRVRTAAERVRGAAGRRRRARDDQLGGPTGEVVHADGGRAGGDRFDDDDRDVVARILVRRGARFEELGQLLTLEIASLHEQRGQVELRQHHLRRARVGEPVGVEDGLVSGRERHPGGAVFDARDDAEQRALDRDRLDSAAATYDEGGRMTAAGDLQDHVVIGMGELDDERGQEAAVERLVAQDRLVQQ